MKQNYSNRNSIIMKFYLIYECNSIITRKTLENIFGKANAQKHWWIDREYDIPIFMVVRRLEYRLSSPLYLNQLVPTSYYQGELEVVICSAKIWFWMICCNYSLSFSDICLRCKGFASNWILVMIISKSMHILQDGILKWV